MHKIQLGKKVLLSEHGARLSEVLTKAGETASHPCGGKGICKKCTVHVNGKSVLACQYKVESDVVVTLTERTEILSESGAEETYIHTDNMCFALDIGTTTLALALVSTDHHSIVEVSTATNPQSAFGADVMTRIDFCGKNGVKKLQKILISRINDMIARFCLPKSQNMYVSGNATMLHLLFGVDPSSMGVAPYTAAFLDQRTCSGHTLGLTGIDSIIALPSISSFVGADIVAGLNYVGMPKHNNFYLLVDLGTNAEIVLFSDASVLSTAAAAGPCFEGANIRCGMSAEEGAIYSYKDGKANTIGDIPAKGICGTGLIDILAELIDNGTIDESGYMECERFALAEGVWIEQADIRQFQVAKSAVCSGIESLVRRLKISYDDIEKVYISGGFSAQINIDHAVKTGLIPKQLRSKCIAVKNTSLLGTAKFAFEQNDLSEFLELARYVDLSTDTFFSEQFIENMGFSNSK